LKHNFVLGIFSNRHDAEQAVKRLEDSGYSPKEISIIVKDEAVREELVQSTGANVVEGIAQGVTTGGVVGGLVGLLVGLGAITIPGLGALLIGGPLAAALGLGGAAATTVSAAATGALAGGVIGALVGLGIPEETARYYEEQLKEGAVLLAVSPKDTFTETQVRQIFSDTHAQQVHYLQ
jgi:hypothetical protein